MKNAWFISPRYKSTFILTHILSLNNNNKVRLREEKQFKYMSHYKIIHVTSHANIPSSKNMLRVNEG